MRSFSVSYAVALTSGLDLSGSPRRVLRTLLSAPTPVVISRGRVPAFAHRVEGATVYAGSRAYALVGYSRTQGELEVQHHFEFQARPRDAVILSTQAVPLYSFSTRLLEARTLNDRIR